MAFDAFYRRHIEAVTRFLSRWVDDPHTVADLAADVFLAVFDSAHTYRPGKGSEIALLYGVARNTLAAGAAGVPAHTSWEWAASARRRRRVPVGRAD
ncbi:sigma factor [Nonomuraea angiospora]|uniref:RNA polymerase sigma factor n=1 Tax=Nonomuraea angiospora TaxID=46172 RepID=UPI0033F4D83E